MPTAPANETLFQQSNPLDSASDRRQGTAEYVAVSRQTAKKLWSQTDLDTKIILSRKYAGLSDKQIAEAVAFNPLKPDDRKSRAWVTTKYNAFGEALHALDPDMTIDDATQILSELETLILEFRIPKDFDNG